MDDFIPVCTAVPTATSMGATNNNDANPSTSMLFYSVHFFLNCRSGSVLYVVVAVVEIDAVGRDNFSERPCRWRVHS